MLQDNPFQEKFGMVPVGAIVDCCRLYERGLREVHLSNVN